MAHSSFDDSPLEESLKRLFSLQTFGIKLGLEPITRLLDAIGNPHHSFPSIHVAGTNGKGSVCALVASVLSAAGHRVGLYSSPHLVGFAERIRVDGREIPSDRLARYADEMLPVIEELGCTFFEGTTAMGFRYFAEEEVDVAVVETGLGGRLDATNVLSPLVTAITSIGLDHTRHLGDTLEEIALEKGGIMKGGVPTVLGHLAPRLRELLTKHGAEVGGSVVSVDDLCRALFRGVDFEATYASFVLNGRELADVAIGLVGEHQMENGRTALAVVDQLRERFSITDEHIREGFRDVRMRSGIRGRFEKLRERPTVVLDVAHNPDGAAVLIRTLIALGGLNLRVLAVFGAVEEKDVAGIMRTLHPVVDHLYAVRADNHRSLPADEIAYRARAEGITATEAGSVASGIARAIAEATENDLVLICGSFYVVGEAIGYLEGKEVPSVERPDVASIDKSAPPVRGYWPSLSDHPVMNQLHHQGEAAATAASAPLPYTDPTPTSTRRITVKEWTPGEQPRERLMMLGPKPLSDAELLAILLRTGTRKEDVIQVARGLLNKFQGLGRLSERDYKELQQVDGIGPTKAVTLAAAFELARRVGSVDFGERPTISGPEDVAKIYIPKLRGIKKEQFHVLILDTANKVIRMDLVSEGNLNSSIVHPREVFRLAIIENAAAIVGIHNHPSGNPTPSREDIAVTRQLVDAGRIIGVPFHDHIIVAGEEFVSMAQKGYA